MSIPVYPNIPYLHEDGSVALGLTDGKSRSATDMDSGPQRMRRRFSSVQAPISFKVLMTDSEFEEFKTFYKTTLEDGTKWFLMPIFSGSSYLPHVVRFNPGFIPQFVSSGFKKALVSFDLTVRELYTVSETVYWLLGLYGFDVTQNMIDNADRFVNECWPGFVEGWE